MGFVNMTTQAQLDSYIRVTPAFGVSSSGLWFNSSVLRIRVNDAGNASAPFRTRPRISDLVFRVVGGLRNAAGTSLWMPTNINLTATGSWGAPVITRITLANPLPVAYGPGISVILDFDSAIHTPAGGYNETVLRNRLTFSPPIGVNFEGWVAGAGQNRLVINITTVFAQPGYRSDFLSMVITSTGFQDLQQLYTQGVHVANASADPGILIDNWPALPNPPAPSVVRFEAINANGDMSLTPGDAVEIEFNVPTNWGIAGRTYSSPAQLSWLQPQNVVGGANVSVSFGTSFTGAWITGRILRITYVDTSGCTVRPVASRVFITAAGGIQDSTNTSLTVDALTGFLTGTYVSPVFAQVYAYDNNNYTAYADGDSFTISFNTEMNFTGGNVISQATLDSWFTFSDNLGQGYFGVWSNAYNLQITVNDTTGNNVTLDTFRITGKPSGMLQDKNQMTGYIAETSPLAGNGWAQRMYCSCRWQYNRIVGSWFV